MTISAKKWVLVGICVLFATLTEAPTEATLIMAFYNGESLYVGSDSLAKTTDGRYVKGQPKIRVGANGLLFSLTGVASFDVAVGVEGRRLKFDCAEQMQSAFRERRDQPLKVCVTNAVVLFDRVYENFCREATAAGTREFDRTLFIFWGYDDRSKSFFGLEWACQRTNKAFHVSYDSKTNAGQLFLVGQSEFLDRFIENHNNFPTVELSDSSRRTWDKIVFKQPVSGQEVISEMVELFAVHKKYAPSLVPGSEPVGEPYIIWRLGKNDTKRLGEFSSEVNSRDGGFETNSGSHPYR